MDRDLHSVILWLFGFLALLAIIGVVAAVANLEAGSGRSPHMAIARDPGSGCEYLLGAGGTLTPRLDRDGRHVCREPRR